VTPDIGDSPPPSLPAELAAEQARFIAWLGADAADASTLATGRAADDTGLWRFERGRHIGRHVVIDRLGAGAMGVVLRAYDPELDRRVAIKVLHPRSIGERSRARVLREARALARLAHPNVVSVFELGEHDGSVFVAMELVVGETLRHWIAAQRPAPHRIVEAYTQAARGLAAAHAIGLVHRDFKPDNCMRGDDGRVRVLDFGLVGISREDDEDDETRASSNAARGTTSTATGTILGTPAYMAPEQYAGTTVDARADQFALCVALFEALEGERPFAGPTIAALADAIACGRRRPWSRPGLPHRWRRAIERGLSVRPEDRFATMDELVVELRPPTRAAWIGVAVAALSIAGVWAVAPASAPSVCSDGSSRVAAIWSDDRRAHVAATLGGSGAADAELIARSVVTRIDDRLGEWSSLQREACEAAHVQGSESRRLLDPRMACLDRRLDEIGALVDQLARADAEVTTQAANAVGTLPAAARCWDHAETPSDPPEPPPLAFVEEVAALRATLADSTAAARVARFDEAIASASAALEEATRIGYRPGCAEALAALGSAEIGAARLDAGVEHYREAYFVALQSNHREVQADAAVALVVVIGAMLERPDEGLEWSRHAEAAIGLAGNPPEPEAMRLAAVGDILRARGDYTGAERSHRAAIEVFDRLGDPAHPRRGRLLMGLGDALLYQARVDEAIALYEEAAEHARVTLSPNHPAVGLALEGICIAALDQQRADDAESACSGALALYERAFGPEDPSVAVALAGLADAARIRGAFADAVASLERARAIVVAALGEDHPEHARVHGKLGAVHHERGDLDAARTHWLRSVEIGTAALGAEHPDVALAQIELASIDASRGRWADARARIGPALAVAEQTLGATHPIVLHAGVIAASVELGDGSVDVATARLRELRVHAAELGPTGAQIVDDIDRLFAASTHR
jgi:tetratricopeptide (TPR) repeat protein